MSLWLAACPSGSDVTDEGGIDSGDPPVQNTAPEISFTGEDEVWAGARSIAISSYHHRGLGNRKRGGRPNAAKTGV